jgi:hypothetical protein
LPLAQVAETFGVLPSDLLKEDADMNRINFECARVLNEWKTEMRRAADEEARIG